MIWQKWHNGSKHWRTHGTDLLEKGMDGFGDDWRSFVVLSFPYFINWTNTGYVYQLNEYNGRSPARYHTLFCNGGKGRNVCFTSSPTDSNFRPLSPVATNYIAKNQIKPTQKFTYLSEWNSFCRSSMINTHWPILLLASLVHRFSSTFSCGVLAQISDWHIQCHVTTAVLSSV